MNDQTFIRVKTDSRKELKLLAAEEHLTMIEMLGRLIDSYKKSKEVSNVSTGETATKYKASC